MIDGRGRFGLPAAAALGALLVVGACRADDDGAAGEEAGEVTSAGAEEAEEAEPETSPERAMAALEEPLAPAEVSLSPAQLEVTRAQAARTWRIRGTPVRVIVLDYASPQAAADAIEEVIGWANGSGLVHHAEATANMSHMLIIGTTSTETPSPEIQGTVDRYVDAFIGAP